MSQTLDSLHQLRAETLPERVARQLMQLILDENLVPGSALPAMSALSQRLGVSHSVVREGIRILATRGLVEIRHGRVARVRAEDGSVILEGLKLSVLRRAGSLSELYEVRRVLETGAVALAARRRQDDDLRRLEATLERMRQTLQQAGDDNIEADVDFHAAIALATHNVILLALLEPVSQVFRAVLRSLANMPRELRDASPPPQGHPDWPTWSHSVHLEIYQAIVNRDEAAAQAALLHHLNGSEERWRHLELSLNRVIADLPLW